MVNCGVSRISSTNDKTLPSLFNLTFSDLIFSSSHPQLHQPYSCLVLYKRHVYWHNKIKELGIFEELSPRKEWREKLKAHWLWFWVLNDNDGRAPLIQGVFIYNDNREWKSHTVLVRNSYSWKFCWWLDGHQLLVDWKPMNFSFIAYRIGMNGEVQNIDAILPSLLYSLNDLFFIPFFPLETVMISIC